MCISRIGQKSRIKMSKKNNIIEINGQRYDARTGAPLSQHGHTPVTKPITVHHNDAKPPVATHKHTADRQPAKKLSRRPQQRSTTLMRRAVKKPPASLKRHVKAQGHTGTLVEEPAAPVVPKLSFGSPDPKRLQHASHIKKSRLITHFNFSQGHPAYTVIVTVAKPSAASAHPPATTALPKRQPAPDASDIFERAVQQATSHLEPAPKTPKKRRLHFARKHARA